MGVARGALSWPDSSCRARTCDWAPHVRGVAELGRLGRCARVLARAPFSLRESGRDEFVHERLRQGAVDIKVQRALRHRVALELIPKLTENGAAERHVAQVILEGGKAGDGRTAHPESREPVG